MCSLARDNSNKIPNPTPAIVKVIQSVTSQVAAFAVHILKIKSRPRDHLQADNIISGIVLTLTSHSRKGTEDFP